MKVKIKEVMKKRNLSPYKFAQKYDISPQTVYSWVSGRTQPNYQNQDFLCSTLECGMGDLYEAEPAAIQKTLL